MYPSKSLKTLLILFVSVLIEHHLVAGTGTGENSTIGGGSGNIASGNGSTVSGGINNSSTNNSAVVGGGTTNSANGWNSAILGGQANIAFGNGAVIGGGYGNTAGNIAVVVGGENNKATNQGAFVGAGSVNNAYGWNSVIVGGQQNVARDDGTFVGGGYNNQAQGKYSVISGGQSNSAGSSVAGVSYCTIAGGWSNTALSSFATVSGGAGNNAGTYASIGGGQWNIAAGIESTVAGGANNTCLGVMSTICGGYANSAKIDGATVCGGISNVASGINSFVAGGTANTATNYAFAAGYGAQATNQGAFVWSSQVMTTSTNAYSFTVRAPGGVRFLSTTNTNNNAANIGVILKTNATAWSVLSDRNSKENFQSIDETQILDKLEQMPVTKWNYKHDPNRDYIGPTAQDFKAAFGLGDDDKSINTLDEAGVTLAAIKGLGKQLKARDQQIAKLQSDIHERDAKMESLARKLDQISARLNQLPPAP
jgi:trimeric autotransporter adhesin